MKAFTTSLILCAVAAAASAAKVSPQNARQGGHSVLDTRYIIEVAEASDIPTKRGVVTPHAHVYSALREKGVKFKVNKEFNTKGLFVGASITVNGQTGLASLVETPGIVSVRPVQQISRPEPVRATVVHSKSDPSVPADTQSTHKLTGVDKLHAEGILGKGIKIGIIDTGTDYTHPYLGGGFGAGYKVAGGYDFVGDAYNGSNTPVPDNDPLDQCAGHGTHVAGIIGADPGNPFNISGVAYQSSIYSYRVFGCKGSVQDDIIIEALLKGFNDNMDILTLSLGGANGWTESASEVVASKIAARGVIVTIAAGNDGAYGSWYTSSPGNGLNVISVSSTDNTVISLQTAIVSGPVSHAPIPYDSLFPLPINGTHEVYATSKSSTETADACNPLPTTTPNLADKIVLIRRGSCTFVTKLANAAAFGAKYFLIDNNVPGYASVTVGNYTAALITPEDGQFLRSQFAAGATVSLTFPQTGGYAALPDPNGGLVSSFTSYGPSFDMYFKPAVAAPGGNILSTYPVPLGAYAVLSGTSMATPFMAGVSALLFQAKSKLNKADVGLAARDLYQSTAMPVAQTHNSDSLWETLTHQGAGLVNAYNAIHSTTVVSPAQLLLNDTRSFEPVQRFKITNNGNKKVTYTLGHVAAGTAVTIPAGSPFAADGPVPLVANAASVSFSQDTVTLGPGAHVQITATFSQPTGLDAKTLPAYSGWITITSPKDAYTVSYLGVAGTLYSKQVLDTTATYFGVPIPAIFDPSGNVQNGTESYNFTGSNYPSLVYRLAFGTAKLTFDLVAGKTKAVSASGSFKSVKVLGHLAEADYNPRNSDATTEADNGYGEFDLSRPVFSNGTTIPNGSYKILLRALKVSGDPTKEADYESWLSPVVTIAA